MLYPRKVKRPKMGVRLVVRTEFKRHEAYVRTYGCSVSGCDKRPIHFHHLRSTTNAGMSAKPHSGFGIGYCWEHHEEAESKGDDHMEREHGVKRWDLAAWFVKHSPDRAMRESFDQLPPQEQGLLFEERFHA